VSLETFMNRISLPVYHNAKVVSGNVHNEDEHNGSTNNTLLNNTLIKKTSSYKDKSKVKSNKPKKNDDDFLQNGLSEEDKRIIEAFKSSIDRSKSDDSDTNEQSEEEEEPCHDLTYLEEETESEEETIIDPIEEGSENLGDNVDNSENIVDNREIREKIRAGLGKYGFDLIEDVLADPSLYEKASKHVLRKSGHSCRIRY